MLSGWGGAAVEVLVTLGQAPQRKLTSKHGKSYAMFKSVNEGATIL